MRRLTSHLRRSIARRISHREDGFTMIAAIMILFTTSLLVTVTLVSTGGDIALTHNSINQKKAYYAALAGISAYQYELNSNSNYWKSCPTIPKNKSTETERTVQGTEHETTPEHYVVETMPSEEPNGTSHTKAECESGKQLAIIQTKGSADGTFRIESTGSVGTGSEKVERKLVATFSHPGFLNYVYLTNYEVLDPAAQNPEPTGCEHYYKERVEKGLTGTCGTIEFAPEDKVNGPLHTNDATAICASGGKKPTFGREGHKDKIEINGGRYAASGCTDEWDMLGEFTEKGPVLTPPETDTELLPQAEQDKALYTGRTEIELKTGDTMKVTNNKGETKIEDIPSDGVIYVENEGSCGVKYSPFGTDTDYETDQKCGDVYVHGEYTEQLTIAAQNDVIINGNIKTKTNSKGEPEGEGTLGLIATNFVRIYHPVAKEYKAEQSTPKTATPTIVYKEETPLTREKLLEQSPTVTEETLEQAPTIKEKTLEEAPTVKEKTVEEAGTGSKKETCKTGFTYSKTTKMCVEKVVEESCPTGYTLTNKKCTKKVSEEVCSEGYTLSSKKCTKKVTVEKCPSGYTLANKKCTEKVTEEYCNTGYTLTNKKCVATTGEETCGNGYKLNSKKQCVASCPNGQTYEEAEGLCFGKCASSDTSLGKGVCEYENSSKGCDAENENASEDPRKWGFLENPIIDAAILSTAHSFIVDNFQCGKHLGELTVWGAIAQYWRGPVGEGEHGYTKNYNYDERLAYLQPPDFLTPTSSQLKLDRITSAG